MLKKFNPSFLDDVKSHAQDLGLNFLQVARDGKSIVCPFCNNGVQGDSGTGVTFNSNGVTHCFVCGDSFNIFQAVMIVKNCAFPEAVKLCADYLGIPVQYAEEEVTTNNKSAKTPKSNDKVVPINKVEKKLEQARKSLTDYYPKCTENLFKTQKAIDYLKSRALFDEQLIKDFRIGYDPDVNCIVVPHDDFYCTRRTITDDKKLRFVHNLKGVSVSIFNAPALLSSEVIFITEGAMDALSIIKVGGNAIAIGGAGNSKLLENIFKEDDDKPAFLILTDDDKAGKKSAAAISKVLLDVGAFFERITLPDNLDANDWLVKDEDSFKRFIDETVAIFKIKASLDRNSKNTIRATAENFKKIFANDPNLKGCIAYNVFNGLYVRRRYDLLWDKPQFKKSVWNDADDSAAQNYIEAKYKYLRNQHIYLSALSEYASDYSFHPVHDYLNSLTAWDGVERAETIFIDALGVEDTEYARTISLKWLLAAVTRVFNPGCKFDYCLVFKGEQGIGKSTVVAKLAVNWFNDSISNIDNKDAVEGLLGNWIIELGEMQATRKADNEAIKAFISRQTDKVRLPYGRRTEAFPRQCVFSATTNNEEFLKDRTGARRFWILICNATIDTTKERLDKLDRNYIDQLWAEVMLKYKALAPKVDLNDDVISQMDTSFLDIPVEIRKTAIELQAKHTEGSELIGMVESFCKRPVPYLPYWYRLSLNARRKFFLDGYAFISRDELNHIRNIDSMPANVKERIDNDLLHMGSTSDLKLIAEVARTRICAVEIANELLKIDNPSKDRRTINEINEIMQRLPNWRQAESQRLSFNVYGQQRISFERIK